MKIFGWVFGFVILLLVLLLLWGGRPLIAIGKAIEWLGGVSNFFGWNGLLKFNFLGSVL